MIISYISVQEMYYRLWNMALGYVVSNPANNVLISDEKRRLIFFS